MIPHNEIVNNVSNSINKKDVDFNKLIISIMDVDKFISDLNLMEVTSHAIKDNITNKFDDQGLFSESIFGDKSSEERLTRLGYINLYVKIIHPFVYKKLIDLDKVVAGILNGSIKGKWSAKDKRFYIATEDESGDNVGTGYTFFKKYVNDYQLKENITTSTKKQAQVKALNKFKSRWLIDKLIVLPPGIRDIHEDDGRISKDDINSMYVRTMTIAKSYAYLQAKDREINPIYNQTTLQLQQRVNDIYTYLYDFLNGKHGFLQSKFGARNVALTTRNVIVANSIDSDNYDDPDFLSSSEIQLPLIEAMKEATYLVANKFITMIDRFTNIASNTKISAIDPKTYQTTFVEISIKEKEKFSSIEKVNDLITLFIKREFRYLDVSFKGKDNKDYMFMLVYDDTDLDEMFITTNKEHLMNALDRYNIKFDQSKLRFLTYYELMYFITYMVVVDKTTTLCRYPITGKWSHQEGKVTVATTAPCRPIRLHWIRTNMSYTGENIINRSHFKDNHKFEYSDDLTEEILDFPQWPDITNGRPLDTIALNTVWLAPMGADFDGDMVSNFMALSNESNEEMTNFIENDPGRLIDPDMRFVAAVDTGSVGKLLEYLTK